MSRGEAGKSGSPGSGGTGGAGPAGVAGRRRALGPVAIAAAGSLLLHAVAVLWVWHSWSGFGRGGVLAWIDFPSSLAYLRLRGGAKLAWSLVAGGLQWAVLGAGLSLLFGSSARRPAD
jgi:hypothetical protein